MKTTITIRINKQFEVLCQILQITPQNVLQDFVDNVSLDPQNSNGSDERSMAIAYFMRVGYGIGVLEYEDVRNLFDELENLRWACYNYEHKAYLVYKRKELAKLQKEYAKKAR